MISLRNLQRRIALDLRWLRRFAPMALEECCKHSADQRYALRSLHEISIAIVSDRRIARVHADFMGIEGPTDVITFEHGEIVASADTALSHAASHGHPVEQEVGLYFIHGFLHLNGFDDRQPADRARMHRVQSRIMKTCLARISAD